MLEIIGCIAIVVLGCLVWSWLTTRKRYSEYLADCWLSGVAPDSFEQFVAHEAQFGKYKVIGR